MSLITSIFINSYLKLNVYRGTNGQYYNLDIINENSISSDYIPVNYDIHFPLDWATDHDYNSQYSEDLLNSPGPYHCLYCKDYGYYNGVFIGYCCNCAVTYNYQRGNGFLIHGIEISCDNSEQDDNINNENSVWNSYLNGVSLNDIGDISLKEEHDIYKDLPDLIPIEINNQESQINEEEEEYDYLDFEDSDYDSERDYYCKLDKLMERF